MNRKNFCAAPWSGLSLDPDGQAKLCCISQDRVPLQEFDQAKSLSKFVEIRKSVIDDQQHTNCSVCWQRESVDTNWESRRSIYQFNDFYHNLDSAKDFQLEHLDLRWSNTCNLNCVYCSPIFSSRWAELQGKKQSFRILPSVTDSDLVNLKILQMAGGEPLLIKENLDVLERLQKINPNVNIEVTTNLTMINNNRIYDSLKQFDNVNWVVSFESTGQQFEYIRNGAKWNEFYNNLNKLAMDFINIQVNMVYFPLSSLRITNAIQVALEFAEPCHVFLVGQTGGHGFDKLSQSALQYIKQHNLDQLTQLPDILQTRLQDQIISAITQQTETLLPLYDKFDRLTNQNHRLIFSELYE